MTAEHTTTVAVWNGGRVFSDAARYDTFAEGVRSIGADVLVVPEALTPDAKDVDPHFASELGYENAVTIAYEDETPHPSGEQYIRVLTKTAVQPSWEKVRLHSRNGIALQLGQAGLELIAAHFDDRNEALRKAMGSAVIERSASNTTVAGDINSAPNTRRTRAWSHIAPLAAALPHPRVRSLAGRLHEMTGGSTLQMLEDAGFRDADPLRQPTSFMRFGGLTVKIAQLDHILTGRAVQSSNFALRRLDGSDQHWPISATLSLQQAA